MGVENSLHTIITMSMYWYNTLISNINFKV